MWRPNNIGDFKIERLRDGSFSVEEEEEMHSGAQRLACTRSSTPHAKRNHGSGQRKAAFLII